MGYNKMKLLKYFFMIQLFNLLLVEISLAGNNKIFTEAPTAQEFADAFYQIEIGIYDPYDVLSEIELLGDRCSKELDKLIFSEKIKPILPELVGIDGGIVKESIEVATNKRYGILALERINTIDAYDILFDVIKKHDDIELKAMALNIINNKYKERVILDEIEPDKHFLKYFIDYLEDLTHIKSYNIKFDKICRNGLKIWLGKDFGDYVEEQDINDELDIPHEKLTKEDKDKWWDDNSPKIKWNKKKNKFEIK